ncbi:MAG: serine/threonine-protein kinase [Gemmatimonas sp.]
MLIDDTFLRLQALVAGRFSLEREIGRGGMGIVYLARDVALERPVAIKVLIPSMAARHDMRERVRRERFLREARIAAQCFHPHIVPIHAVEAADDLAWIVMAYVRGETLADRLRRNGPLDADELRRLGREVGWALSYAHQRGVVHRDIKPENLLIDASTGRYVIADFGIAQAPEQTVTPVGGSIPGTARYMAPEQALGEMIDGRADLYALGVTLFVAATGRAPFEGTTAMALVAQHAAQPAPSVRAFAPAVPLPLARAIDRCLAKRPDDRYLDAAQFLAAIEPDVREQPLATALYAARDHASAARLMRSWSVVIGVTTVMLALGEAPGSFGRAVIGTVGASVASLFAAAMALRGIEALIEARKLLRRGQNVDDVARALAGDAPLQSYATTLLKRYGSGVAMLAGGMGLALAQGSIDSLHLPDALAEASELISLFLPPLLIARGGHGLITSSGIGRWLHERVTKRLASYVSRVLSGAKGPRAVQGALADAPTEMLLVQAVESAVDALPAAHRESMRPVDEIARALAHEATALRAQARQLDAREADAMMLRDSASRAEALDAARRDREAVQGRLQTTMAALESLRLDVMRLSADVSDGDLTTQLERQREVQRRVDAAMDVRRILRPVSTPT